MRIYYINGKFCLSDDDDDDIVFVDGALSNTVTQSAK